MMPLKDIAKLANVSQATVSNVLNGREGVGEEKREQITSILLQYGYSIRKTKETSEKKNIRFIKYADHTMLVEGNPGFVSSIIDSVERECRRQQFNLVMSSFSKNRKRDLIRLIHEDPLDGILIIGTELAQQDVQLFESANVPLVVVDNPFSLEDINSVTMDNRRSINQAILYLQQLGHKKIGFVANALPAGNCLERYKAYVDIMNQTAQKFTEDLVYPVMPTADGAYASMKEYIKNGRKLPAALIANNDCIAIGIIKAFNEFGISIPQDISIIGFDGIPFASLATPALTTIKVFCEDMGVWAVRLLSDRMKYPDFPTSKVLVGTTLLVRSSTTQYDPLNKCGFLLP